LVTYFRSGSSQNLFTDGCISSSQPEKIVSPLKVPFKGPISLKRPKVDYDSNKHSIVS